MYIYAIQFSTLTFLSKLGNRSMNGKKDADQVSRYEFIKCEINWLKAILSHGPDILSERIHFIQYYIIIHFNVENFYFYYESFYVYFLTMEVLSVKRKSLKEWNHKILLNITYLYENRSYNKTWISQCICFF